MGNNYGTRERWTAKHAEQLFQLRSEGKTYREIAAIIGRTLSGVESFFRWRGMTEEQREARNKRLRIVHLRKGKRGRPPGLYGITVRRVEPMRPDPAAVADRDYRVSLPHPTLTAAFFNDPKPGYSALDRKSL